MAVGVASCEETLCDRLFDEQPDKTFKDSY